AWRCSGAASGPGRPPMLVATPVQPAAIAMQRTATQTPLPHPLVCAEVGSRRRARQTVLSPLVENTVGELGAPSPKLRSGARTVAGARARKSQEWAKAGNLRRGGPDLSNEMCVGIDVSKERLDV